METEHVLLSERMQQNASAFAELEELAGFGSTGIGTAGATQSLSLRTLLGGPGAPITGRSGREFYPESPGLLELDDLMETLQAQGKMFRRVAEGLCFILMVDDGDTRRHATLEEIGKEFGATHVPQLLETLNYYSGLNLTGDDEGNA